MTDQFVGEIRIFGGNFAPTGWAFCNGQLMPISQNTALFSLLGTFYGGNGTSTFALPNLQGAAPLMAGQGPGLTSRVLGESGGESTVTLTVAETPAHTHTPEGSNVAGTGVSPTGDTWGVASITRGQKLYAPTVGTGPLMSPQTFGTTGGSQPHNNLPPYLTLTFIIALTGIFPPRS
jgi:microcystin-dependent protein